MNRLVFLIAVALALVPLASADLSIRITNYGGGLTPGSFFDGYNSIGFGNDRYYGSFYNGPNYAYLYGQERSTGGAGFGVGFSRPVRTVQHVGATPNRDYRAYEYGAWRVDSVGVNYPSQGFGAYASRDPYTGRYSGAGYYGSSPSVRTPPYFGPMYGSYGSSIYGRTYGPTYTSPYGRTSTAGVSGYTTYR